LWGPRWSLSKVHAEPKKTKDNRKKQEIPVWVPRGVFWNTEGWIENRVWEEQGEPSVSSQEKARTEEKPTNFLRSRKERGTLKVEGVGSACRSDNKVKVEGVQGKVQAVHRKEKETKKKVGGFSFQPKGGSRDQKNPTQKKNRRGEAQVLRTAWTSHQKPSYVKIPRV